MVGRIVLILLAVAGAIVFLWFALLIGLVGHEASKTRGHQEFAKNGVSQIKPAMQMAQLYPDCRHFVTYDQSGPLFNSVAYFGGRYELTMQVPVKIQSANTGSASGAPKFYLLEVSKISIGKRGDLAIEHSATLEFGPQEWQQVVDADGDFSVIGFTINPTPVPNFRKYANASRPSN